MSNDPQHKLAKYESKLKNSTNNNAYKEKIKIYSNLCNNTLTQLKFYLLFIKFLDTDFIKYINLFSKKQDVFAQIKTDFNFNNLQIKYTNIYENFDFLKNVDIITKELITDLSFEKTWDNAISKIIMLKLLFLYDFNRLTYPHLKDFCQKNIDRIIF